MSERRELGEFFANPMVRHSMELAFTLWGVNMGFIDRDLTVQFPAAAPESVASLFRALLASRKYRKDIETHLAPMFVSSPDWTGPRWFNPVPGVRLLVVPVGMRTGAGVLLCVPFVYEEESEQADHDALLAVERSVRPETTGGPEVIPALGAALRRKLQTHLSTLSREVDVLFGKQLRRSGDRKSAPDDIRGLVGDSPAVNELRQRVRTLAVEDFPVFIVGEVGSGKQTAARAMHGLGGRRNQPFAVVNCQSMPYSDLTHLVLGRTWRFGEPTDVEKAAAGGTVLFEGIEFLPSLLQYVFVRLCDGRVEGGLTPPRVLATSSLSLDALEKLGALRPEVLSFLRGEVLSIPPLRRRKEDVPSLVADMLIQLRGQYPDFPSEVNRDVLRLLQNHEWPGNLWELKGEVRSMATAARGRREVGMQDVSRRLAATSRSATPADSAAPVKSDREVSLPDALEALERTMLMDALNATRWNRSRTARLLGVSRRNLIRKIERYQLDRRKPPVAKDKPQP